MSTLSIDFPSGVRINDPLGRLRAFLEWEYPYYDAFVDDSPNNIIPLDVFAAAGVNAFIGGGGANRLRTIHRGMSRECDHLLAVIGTDQRLDETDDIQPIVDVIAAACSVKSVLSAVASKILHRKRRNAIPMLDSVMVEHCCSTSDARCLAASDVSDTTRKAASTSVIGVVRNDLQSTRTTLEELQAGVAEMGWSLTTLRIHDILVWTELEKSGYYRS